MLRADGRAEAPREIAERACSFDVVLRLASGRIDTMHATIPFFEHPDNGHEARRALARVTDEAHSRLGNVLAAMTAFLVANCTLSDLLHPSSH